MKFLVLAFIAISFLSCKDTTSEFDSLDPLDREYIRNIASAECRATFSSAYTRYVATSELAYASSDFQRGDGYLHEFKEGTTVTKSVDIRVWKQTADDLYFYVTETLSDASLTNYFLRLNKVTNAEIIADLAEDHCTKVYSCDLPLSLDQFFLHSSDQSHCA